MRRKVAFVNHEDVKPLLRRRYTLYPFDQRGIGISNAKSTIAKGTGNGLSANRS